MWMVQGGFGAAGLRAGRLGVGDLGPEKILKGFRVLGFRV